MVINERYVVQDYLGKGGFSRVMKCFDNRLCISLALKMINDKGFDDRREIEIMKIVSSSPDSRAQVAIKYLDSFRYDHRDYVVIELAGVNLYDFLFNNRDIPFSLSFIRSVAKQLLLFLSFLHSKGIIHCDIKPENIMLKNDAYDIVTISDDTCADPESVSVFPKHEEIKVIDFGLATFSDNRLHFSTVGTRPYCSPEMILQNGWTYATDLWSVGCTLLEMYLGHQIFNGKNEREQLLKMEIVLGKFPQTVASDSHYFSRAGYVNCQGSNYDKKIDESIHPLHRIIDHARHPQFLNFCAGLLDLDPEKRLTCVEALNHPFLNFVD
ncbi:dual specificity protein kinase CLK2, putative [Entamoeba invadens IP1]|uniref:Dual specificity protein kinase CLK2, putative n=1 Tax=Entamoeba invadens IP1 TaxID=370355 RepID=A0A0A1TVK8_ENTIV|nr:dual specificity protein kinase CLK2, putative [Entamoeba invadens IP1]ELP84489.1 dual specificity protein kinase CLK2, putative [Entamoeba invadens IP1]|eukprot:XP_004183835.1 dual specificity protein kinase CLK2, putative [Entamoeba invadens IP1]